LGKGKKRRGRVRKWEKEKGGVREEGGYVNVKSRNRESGEEKVEEKEGGRKGRERAGRKGDRSHTHF